MFAFAQEPRSREEVEPVVVEVAGGGVASADEAADGAAAATVQAEAEPVSEPVLEDPVVVVVECRLGRLR